NFDKGSGVIAFIGNHVLRLAALQERRALGDIVGLPSGEYEVKWITQSIDHDMDFSAEAAPTPSKRLFCLFRFFDGGACGTRMCPNGRTIQEQALTIGIVSKVRMHLLKDTAVTPTSKAFVDAIPLAIAFWNQFPLGATTNQP